MGKIFGISKLPVSTIGETIQPTQKLGEMPFRRTVKRIPYNIKKTLIKDVFVERPKNPSIKAK